MKRFTDKHIRSLKPKDKPYDMREKSGEGFGIRVLPSGTKTWFTIYRRGKEKARLGHGQYPAVSLADARALHRQARDLLKQGKDPAEIKRKEKVAETVAELAKQYIERWAKLRKRSWKEDERILYKDVLPAWGKRRAKEITRKDIIALLEKIAKRGPVMANRTFACIRKMYGWAVSVGILETSPCYGIQAPSKEEPKDRVLTQDEIRVFWTGLENAAMSEEVRRILKLILVTAQRPGECAAVCWEEIDLNTGWWTIPAEKTKNRRAHRVPLTDLAIELLGMPGKGPAFPSPRTSKGNLKKSIHVNALGHALRRALKPNEKTGVRTLEMNYFASHDLRRTAASHMTGSGIPRLTVAKILNHAEGSVTAIYDRHSYDPEKQLALEAWSRKLRGILEGKETGKVVPLTEKR